MKKMEVTLPVQRGSFQYDRILSIQRLYQKIEGAGVLNALTNVIGTPLRGVILDPIDGVNDWKQPLYRGSVERHQLMVESFKNGKWVGNIQLAESDEDEAMNTLKAEFLRLNDSDGFAQMIFTGNELILNKGKYKYSTILHKKTSLNMRKLNAVFAHMFGETSTLPPSNLE